MWYNEPSALEKNAAKNRGSAQDWFGHSSDYSDPVPKARVRPEAQKIVSKHSTSHIPFDPRAPADQRQPPEGVTPLRVRGDDAVANAAKHIEPPEKWYDFEGNLQYSPDPRKPRCYGGAAQNIVDKMMNPDGQEWYKHKAYNAHEQQEVDEEELYHPGSTMQGKQIKEKMTRQSDWFAHHTVQDVNANESGAIAGDAEWRPPRTAGAGSNYAVRNIRGTSSDWILTHDPNYTDERPAPRLASRQATEISEKHNGSPMKSCLTHTGEQYEDYDTPPQRIYTSAKANYIRNRGIATQLMTGEMEVEPDLGTRNLVGKLASDIAERHRGQMGTVLDQSSNADYRDELPKARAPTAAAQKHLERARGTFDVGDASYRHQPETRNVHPRGLPIHAANNAEKHKGDAVNELVSNFQLPPDEAPAQRVAGPRAQLYASRSAGVGPALLAHNPKAPADTPPPLRMTAAAQRIADRHASNNISKTLQMTPLSSRANC